MLSPEEKDGDGWDRSLAKAQFPPSLLLFHGGVLRQLILKGINILSLASALCSIVYTASGNSQTCDSHGSAEPGLAPPLPVLGVEQPGPHFPVSGGSGQELGSAACVWTGHRQSLGTTAWRQGRQGAGDKQQGPALLLQGLLEVAHLHWPPHPAAATVDHTLTSTLRMVSFPPPCLTRQIASWVLASPCVEWERSVTTEPTEQDLQWEEMGHLQIQALLHLRAWQGGRAQK